MSRPATAGHGAESGYRDRLLPGRPGYRPDIDGLRAIAVLAVVLFHCGVPGLAGGYVGVDVFFVISGFLITSHLVADAGAGRLSLASFYEQRIRRIAPALVVCAVATWLAACVILLPSYFLDASRALVAVGLGLANVYLWKTLNYFHPSSVFQPFLHMWSLAVEEQFYFVVPLTMLLVARWMRQRWYLLFAPVCLASFCLSVYATSSAPTANFFLLPTRAWELGVGALVATTPLPCITGALVAELVSLAAGVLVLAPMFLFGPATPFPGIAAVPPCLGAAALIHVGRSARPRLTCLLGTRAFVAVGLISYSLYLVHWPVISLWRFRTLMPMAWPGTLFCIVLSLTLSALVWRFVEQPFRRPRRWMTRRTVLGGGAAAMACTCLLGSVGILEQGLPGRFPDFAEADLMSGFEASAGDCFLPEPPDYHDWSVAKCTRVARGSRRILLWGDSFAAHYVSGIEANQAGMTSAVLQYTAEGCPPLLSYFSLRKPKCTEFNSHVLQIVREQHIDIVIISCRWSYLGQLDLTKLPATIAALRELGVEVVVIGQSPEFIADVQVISFLRGSRDPDAVNQWRVTSDYGINTQIAALSHEGRFVDPMPALCRVDVCIYQDHGRFMFADDGHLSPEGSRRVVHYMETMAVPLVP